MKEPKDNIRAILIDVLLTLGGMVIGWLLCSLHCLNHQ
jgi:hypothetical protein